MWNSPIAKAEAPFVLSLVAAAVNWASSGVFNAPELYTLLGGAVAALVVYLVPNAKPSV